MEKYGVIYQIKNKVNGKMYIGQTVQKNPMRRIRRHFNKKSRTNEPLYNSINKYGEDQFEINILATAFDINGLNYIEALLIKKNHSTIPNGCNIKLGGEQGGKLLLATKDKIGKKSKAWYSKNSHPLKGKTFTEKHKQNLSKVRKGFTSVARREAQKKNAERTAMPVKAIHIETGKEYKFKSLDDCAKELGLQGCNISRVLNKRQNRTQHKGYKFERLEK